VRVLVVSAWRAGFTFEEAWRLALEAALSYMPDKKADDWWDVLWSTRQAWADAYLDRRSPLSILPREVPWGSAAPSALRARAGGDDASYRPERPSSALTEGRSTMAVCRVRP
jgi:hypothetical protein